MKIIKYVLFLFLAFFTFSTVNAATITSATYNDSFVIKGTGTGEISIALFDLNNNPIYFTTATATSGTFSITLPKIDGLKNGNYKVKVADYDGTNAVSKSVAVTLTNNPEIPETSDNINFYIILATILSILIIASGIYLKKELNNKKSIQF